MDFLEVIEKRHSVRKFTDESVERDLLDAIIGIAQTAPSSKNSHSTAVMVIEDKDTLHAVSEMRERRHRVRFRFPFEPNVRPSCQLRQHLSWPESFP